VNNRFQRIDSVSNTKAGKDFELLAQAAILASENINLQFNISLEVGVAEIKKRHTFDLGSHTHRIIVECKSHRWTTGNNVPSAKITTWHAAMYYFLLAPASYRKIFFCLHHHSEKHRQSMAEYYIKHHSHLIPRDVEIWEYCESNQTVNVLLDHHRNASNILE
jgi:hypothetical protein